MEVWDLYNKERKPLDKIISRGNKIPKGEYHVIIEVWVINNQNQILLTLRDPGKEKYPNLWENTGGSVLAGESSKAGAKRELFEETGICIEESDLFYIGTSVEKSAFMDQYIIRKDIKVSEIVLQQGETVGAKLVSIEELDKMMKKGEVALPVVKRLELIRDLWEQFIFYN